MDFVNCYKLEYIGVPCGYVAVMEASGNMDLDMEQFPTLKDGYMSLRWMNKLARHYLRVRKFEQYKRGERPLLRDFSCEGRAIICVLGHFVYAENNRYYSCFSVGDCEVVAVWHLKD